MGKKVSVGIFILLSSLLTWCYAGATVPQIEAGDCHTVTIKSDGSLWAWGCNTNGQLGDGTTANNSNPTRVGIDNNWATVAAGGYHTVAIKSDGSLWAWGYNYWGQVGNGGLGGISIKTPIRIGVDNNWVSVAAGYSHTVAVKSDGSLWAWGYNLYGQLGDGTNSYKSSPNRIGIDSNWTTVIAYENHTLAIKSDGSLWAWGYNAYGQLGDGTTINKASPTRIGVDIDWSAVAAGAYHIIAIKSDGSLWAWGYNAYGQLGDGTTINKTSPVRIGVSNDWLAIGTGLLHTVAIKSNGSLWAWGANFWGALGDGTSFNKTSPIMIGVDNNWASVAAGDYHTLGIKSDGSLWTWGDNSFGQLGNGTFSFSTSPKIIGVDNDWDVIDGGVEHTAAIKTDGSLWTWGSNNFSQLGDGTNINKTLSVRLGTDYDWATIAAGYYHTLAIKTDGSLWAWGYNNYGQVGDGTNDITKNIPVRVGTDNNWLTVAAGEFHTLGIKTDGSLWAWGWNNNGQLGIGSAYNVNMPIRVGIDNDWAVVSTGKYHTVALKSDGSLWTWGNDLYGQLGNGTGSGTRFPTRIGVDNNWVAIAAGEVHTAALKTDGSLWAWGYNANGQLGDGTITNRTSPIRIGTDNNWFFITGGMNHTVALKSDGSLWAWGYNNYGQVGDGTSLTKNVPTRIGVDNNWAVIGTGGYHTLSIKLDGSLWAWGYNGYGQLGDGTAAYFPMPIMLVCYDVDGDGFCSGYDCNDNNIYVYSGAPEVCDSLDNNCNGNVDEGFTGLGNLCSVSTGACMAQGAIVCSQDGVSTVCNAIPGQPTPEFCDGVDNDCDGFVDNGVQNSYYLDTDGDGYGNSSVSILACSPPAGYVSDSTDCNDVNPSVNPAATEVCNNIDDNCNGLTDEGVQNTYYLDADGDTYGTNVVNTFPSHSSPIYTVSACSAPPGYVAYNTDCNDYNASISPGAAEVCDSTDNNCNGSIDESFSDLGSLCSVGTGACTASGVMVCSQDGNVTVCSATPGQPNLEVCNGIDDNCNGQVDESIADIIIGTDVGACQSEIQSCMNGVMTVVQSAIGSTPEVCNGIDDNCDGQTDEGVQSMFYLDMDGDSFGDATLSTQACTAPSGYTQDNTDCDDNNASINPAAPEIPSDGIDQDCSGADLIGNHPPTANAGIDQHLECAGSTCPIILDGSASTDPDSTPGTQDGIATYKWYEGYGTQSQTLLGPGVVISTNLTIGVHIVTLEVTDKSGATSYDTVAITVDPAHLSLLVLEKAEIDWPMNGETLAEVKIHGKLALPVGLLPAELAPKADISLNVAGQAGVLSQPIDLVLKGENGEKWEYKANPNGAGTRNFSVHWKGARFKYENVLQIKTEFIGLTETGLSIDRKGITDAVTLTVNGISISIDTAGTITSSVPHEYDEDGEVTFTLPFELTPSMEILLNVGIQSTVSIRVSDYYTPGSGEFELKAKVNPGILTGSSRPATLQMNLALGNEGFPGSVSVSETQWKTLSVKEWKANLKD